MSEKPIYCSARDWSRSPEIRLLASRLNVSGHSLEHPSLRWLTLNRPEIFDEYTRRQYVAKAPDRNPFGTEEEPAKFTEFDVFTKVLFYDPRMISNAYQLNIRFVCCNSSHGGLWEIQTESARRWRNKKTLSRPFG